ncbi:hypothetical protein E4U21_006926 [Claviceps maximensis]|nr:hypothetical protein E4U21_006926 [Claviceps maximensis]
MGKAEKGLETSMWAPVGGMRRTGTYMYNGDGHDSRSRSLPPPRLEAGTSKHRGEASSTYGSASPERRSGHASKTTAATTTTSTSPTDAASRARLRLQSFQRFEQTCHRLRWKFIDLQSSYERALRPLEWSFTPEDAERNFKVDFHEFYAWIEQAIVFLLLVFGVTVGRGPLGTRQGGTWSSFPSCANGTRERGPGSSHAYHHNVLKALEDKYNPLHATLGAGDVIQALWKAKELRNRWKDAAEGRDTPPLKMYDLRWIVASVLAGLEAAYGLAGREVEGDLDLLGREETKQTSTTDEQDEDGWEWMVESMDWEP